MDLVFDWEQETDHLVLNINIYIENSREIESGSLHPSQWFYRISVGQNYEARENQKTRPSVHPCSSCGVVRVYNN